MDFEKLSAERRTIRRFRREALPDEEIRRLLDAARYASCASNRQILRYAVIRREPLLKEVFDRVAWARLVAPRRTPAWAVDAPPCFIAVIAPRDGGALVMADAGAAVQSMELAGWARGIGCCWFASFDPEKVSGLLKLPEDKRVLFLVATGYPAESPVAEEAAGGDVRYYLDGEDRLHVPKLPLNEIVQWM